MRRKIEEQERKLRDEFHNKADKLEIESFEIVDENPKEIKIHTADGKTITLKKEGNNG